jgi:hypothetical protein
VKIDIANKKLSGGIKYLSFGFGLLLCNSLPLLAEDGSLGQNTDAASIKTIDQSQSVKEPESQTPDSKPGAVPVSAAPTKKDIGRKTAHFATHLPQRVGLFTANVIVATPVLFVRRTAKYTASNTKELIGDHKNPVLLVPAGVLSSYYGLTSGLVEGTTFGVINSWKSSADGHISKASLGLEDK